MLHRYVQVSGNLMCVWLWRGFTASQPKHERCSIIITISCISLKSMIASPPIRERYCFFFAQRSLHASQLFSPQSLMTRVPVSRMHLSTSITRSRVPRACKPLVTSPRTCIRSRIGADARAVWGLLPREESAGTKTRAHGAGFIFLNFALAG